MRTMTRSRLCATKKDSSLVKGLTMLKNGRPMPLSAPAPPIALHVGTSLIIAAQGSSSRRWPPMPGQQEFLLLDCGANVVPPEMLNAFGTMERVYAERSWAVKCRRSALVNNGAEGHEGHHLPRGAPAAEGGPLHPFAGNIEARYIMDGRIDVVVCDDGFVGNVVLRN